MKKHIGMLVERCLFHYHRTILCVTVDGVLGVVARDGGVFKIANEGLARQPWIGSSCCDWC